MKKALSFLLTCALSSGVFFTSVFAALPPPTATIGSNGEPVKLYAPQNGYMFPIGSLNVITGVGQDMLVNGFIIKNTGVSNLSTIGLTNGIVARIDGKDIQSKTTFVQGKDNQFYVQFTKPVTLNSNSSNIIDLFVGDFQGPAWQQYIFTVTEFFTNGSVIGLPVTTGYITTTNYVQGSATLYQGKAKYDASQNSIGAPIADMILGGIRSPINISGITLLDTSDTNLKNIFSKVVLVDKYSGLTVGYGTITQNTITFSNLNLNFEPETARLFEVQADIKSDAPNTQLKFVTKRASSIIAQEKNTGYRVKVIGKDDYIVTTRIGSVVSGEVQF